MAGQAGQVNLNFGGGTGSSTEGGSSDPAAPDLSQTRGRDWGLPRNSRGATGITRPIRIVCEPDRLVLLPEDAREDQPVVIPIGGAMADDIDQLVAKIWQRMETWGIAGAGMYWRPVLIVQARSSAESRFRELSSLLRNSGIDVQRK
jgi:hypothetical protein